MKSKIVTGLVIYSLAMLTGYSQPFFYSQSLQNLYNSLPASCRLTGPVEETVVDCAGIVPEGTAPVVYIWDDHGMLVHIGYRFLTGMEMFNPAVIRFLEREMLALLVVDNLEQKIFNNRDNGIYMLHNGNTPQLSFYRRRTGLPHLLKQVSGMAMNYEEGKRYHVDLHCGEGQTLTFVFVANAELLSDMDKKERDDLIAAQLAHHRAQTYEKQPHFRSCDETTLQSHRDSAFVCMGSTFIISQINNNMYYTKNKDGEFELAISRHWIAETLSNVMLNQVQLDYAMQVTHRVYGGVIHRYEVNSHDFFDYFSNDYERYFGIEKIDRDVLTGTLVLADKNAGNIHLAFVSVSVFDLLNGGKMNIQLDTNIPQHNVETLFGKNKQERGEYQFINE